MWSAIVNGMTAIFSALHSFIVSLGIPENKEGLSYVLAIFIFTLIIRLLILPLNIKSTKSNAKMQEIQPELKKIQAKYANDPQKMQLETSKLMKENNVSLRFEASVGGGIPVLKPLTESLEGNDIESMYAILNGTTNFILSKMYDEGLPYEKVLKEAQELGFAEANPEADVEGYDAARKLSILSTLAYHRRVYWKDFYLEGISNLDMKDMDYAKKLGCKIKLVGQSKKNKENVKST